MTHIRTATLNDISAITQIWDECKLTRPWNNPNDDIKNALTTPTSTILLLCNNAQIIGSVMLGYDGHRGWIYYLAVKTEYQKQGCGKKLVEEAENWLKVRNVPKVNLMIRNTNKAVKEFYESIGYKDDEVITMAKWLSTKYLINQTIKTQRLIAKQFCNDDITDFAKMITNQNVYKSIRDGEFWSREDIDACVNRYINGWKNDGYSYHAIRTLESNNFVGVAGFRKSGDDVEFGYIFDEKFWGMGLCQEICTKLLNESTFQRVVAYVFPDNHKSIHIITKLGFMFDCQKIYKSDKNDILRNFYVKDGK